MYVDLASLACIIVALVFFYVASYETLELNHKTGMMKLTRTGSMFDKRVSVF